MKKTLESLSIQKTSRVIGILFFFLTALLFIPLGVMAIIQEGLAAGWAFLWLPFVYGFAIYLLSIVGCWIYNQIASYMGGIEFTLTDEK